MAVVSSCQGCDQVRGLQDCRSSSSSAKAPWLSVLYLIWLHGLLPLFNQEHTGSAACPWAWGLAGGCIQPTIKAKWKRLTTVCIGACWLQVLWAVARVLGLQHNQVHVTCRRVGGGFGGKVRQS
jgi:hypothetical protein